MTAYNNEGLFNLERLPQRPYEEFYDVVMALSFELNPDVRVMERELVTILDAFATMGGF